MKYGRLIELMLYDDGTLYWRDTAAVPPPVRGSLAGSAEPSGYTRIKIDGHKYRRHRLVFLYHHQHLPKYVDHRDGDPTNDRVGNLRACSFAENMQNCKLRKDNKSGAKGVSYHPKSGTWRVVVNANKHSYYLGNFKDKELAELIAEEARDYLHGEFNRT